MRSTRDSRAVLALTAGLGLYLLAAAAGLPGLVCPAVSLLGIECPGCGITRAGMSLLRGDLAAAVRWNPLILFLVPFLVWTAADAAAVCAGRPLRITWPRWWVKGIQASFVVSYLVVTAFRLIG